MLRHLFVYGTLLSGAGHPMGARLARESRVVGSGSVVGRLLDLGAYPALIEAGSGGNLVHGEVHELSDPEKSLRWLDEYEGIVSSRENASEYERVARLAQLDVGAAITAWVYVYRAVVTSPRFIESGRWCGTGN